MGRLLFDAHSDYKIKIKYHDFPDPLKKQFFEKTGMKLNEISFSSLALFKDIVTCGMPSFHITRRRNLQRSEEIKYKIFLMRAALEVDDDGYIIVSDKIKYLDSSERAFISYYIGMFMTKVVSRVIFDYDYLVHFGIVEQYKKVVRGSKEPDLVGFNNKSDEYSLFEAKGRQKIKTPMLTSAKDQLQSVGYISGMNPLVRVVCVSHPIEEGKRITCSMYDPQLKENINPPVSKGELLYLYYLPIYELIIENGAGEASCSFSLDENGEHKMRIHIEMPKKLFEFFSENPSFFELYDKDSQIIEIISSLSENDKDDLLNFKVSEFEDND